MNDIHTLLATAEQQEKLRQYELALKTYSHAFDLLIDAAGAYALHSIGDSTDPDMLQAHKNALLQLSKEYLTRDLTAAIILTHMGLLFAELADYHNAEQKLEEAIDYTPDDQVYDDPHTHLSTIRMLAHTSGGEESLDD